MVLLQFKHYATLTSSLSNLTSSERQRKLTDMSDSSPVPPELPLAVLVQRHDGRELQQLRTDTIINRSQVL